MLYIVKHINGEYKTDNIRLKALLINDYDVSETTKLVLDEQIINVLLYKNGKTYVLVIEEALVDNDLYSTCHKMHSNLMGSLGLLEQLSLRKLEKVLGKGISECSPTELQQYYDSLQEKIRL